MNANTPPSNQFLTQLASLSDFVSPSNFKYQVAYDNNHNQLLSGPDALYVILSTCAKHTAENIERVYKNNLYQQAVIDNVVRNPQQPLIGHASEIAKLTHLVERMRKQFQAMQNFSDKFEESTFQANSEAIEALEERIHFLKIKMTAEEMKKPQHQYSNRQAFSNTSPPWHNTHYGQNHNSPMQHGQFSFNPTQGMNQQVFQQSMFQQHNHQQGYPTSVLMQQGMPFPTNLQNLSPDDVYVINMIEQSMLTFANNPMESFNDQIFTVIKSMPVNSEVVVEIIESINTLIKLTKHIFGNEKYSINAYGIALVEA